MAKQQQTVMIVDDSEIVLEVIGAALEAEGYRVLTRNRPTGCVALMLQEEPDLVLVDVTMPGVGGDTLVRCFGTAHPTSRSIVVLHSSLPEAALSAKAEASGAHGYIRKTDNLPAFIRDVERWLRKAKARRLEDGEVVSPSMTRRKLTPAPIPSGLSAEFGRHRGAIPPGASHSGVSHPGVSGAHRVAGTPSVLLVDGDMLMLSEYRRLLNEENVSVELSLSGEHAVRLMESTPSLVVVCNVLTRMPDGATLFEYVTASNPAWRSQFVLVADHSRVAKEVPAFEAEFPARLLRKPLEPTAFRSAVRSCLTGLGLLSAAG